VPNRQKLRILDRSTSWNYYHRLQIILQIITEINGILPDPRIEVLPASPLLTSRPPPTDFDPWKDGAQSFLSNNYSIYQISDRKLELFSAPCRRLALKIRYQLLRPTTIIFVTVNYCYLLTWSNLDITHSVGYIQAFLFAPSTPHIQAYLIRTCPPADNARTSRCVSQGRWCLWLSEFTLPIRI
jgi:hypothetical protein